MEVTTQDILDRIAGLDRSTTEVLDTLKTDVREAFRQLQTLQGGSGAVEPLSLISGWDETLPRTTPPTATIVGVGQLLLSGTGITMTRVANTPYLRLDANGGLMNADYVVSNDGTGTHLTLFGAAGALQAAIATGASKFIWLCTTHTETVSAQEVLPAFALNQQIIIASGTRERATITFAISSTTVGVTMANANGAGSSLSFKSFRLARSSGTGAFLGPAAGGPTIIADIEFENMDFHNAGSTFNAIVGGSLLADMTATNLTVRGCTGNGALVIQQLGATSNCIGTFIMEDCTMTLDGINRQSSSTSVDWGTSGGGAIMRNNIITHNNVHILYQQNYTMAAFHFDNNVVYSAFAGRCLRTGVVQSGSNIHICNNTYQATAAGAQFLECNSATSNIKNVIVTNNSLDGPGSGTAIQTIFVNTGALPDSIIMAPNVYRDWTTNFDGTAGGATDDFTDVNSDGTSALAAPNAVNYLIGTADTRLPSAIVVGTTPGGELGGTWASPTVDATHSGSTHSAATDTHIADTTDAHDASAISILDTGAYFTSTDVEGALAELGAGGGGGGGGLLTMVADGAAITWTNMPAALTEFNGTTVHRSRVDLAAATTVRLVVDVQTAGVAGSKLRAQYSTDEASWNYLDGSTGPEVAIDATGVKISTTVNLTAGAKADVYLRVVGISGDGAVDPVFGAISLQIDAIGGGTSVASPDAKYVTTRAEATLTAEVVRPWLLNYFQETTPGSSNALDDEFDDTTGMSGAVNGLNARWTWRNQGTSTVAFTTQGYVVLTPQATSLRIIEQTIPAGDWTFEGKFSLAADGSSVNAHGGVALIDSVNGDLYTLTLIMGNSTSVVSQIEIDEWSSVSAFTATRHGPRTFGSNLLFWRVSYVSATDTVTFWVSSDGISYQKIHSRTESVNATRIGLYAADGNSSGLTALKSDYFRRTA